MSAPPPLIDELVEEVLLRLPPDDPAQLIRVALVCKRWRRLVSGPAFLRRFREHHRAPPMLAFLCNVTTSISNFTRLVPAASTRCPPLADCRAICAIDSRHGRVLLRSRRPVREIELVVWDPITVERRELPTLPWYAYGWNAAVLCAAVAAAGGGACDHLDCHRGPFMVVFVGIDHHEVFLRVYSSEAGTWSGPIFIQHSHGFVNLVPSAFVGNTLNFVFEMNTRVLKYDLGTQEISVIHLPPISCGNIMLMATDDGRLGFVRLEGSRLEVWSMGAGQDGDAGWAQTRVIDLLRLLPFEALCHPLEMIGFADGVGVLFMRTVGGVFCIDINSCKARKVHEGNDVYGVVPFMSFYIPALGATLTSKGPRVGDSSSSA